jgi:hypothetical protein
MLKIFHSYPIEEKFDPQGEMESRLKSHHLE